MTTNQSGLSPRGHAVLIRTETAEPKKDSVIQLPESVQTRMGMVDNRAVVVAIGPAAWSDEPEPRASVGDTVLVTKFAGFMATGADGQQYRLINDRDIFCAVISPEVLA